MIRPRSSRPGIRTNRAGRSDHTLQRRGPTPRRARSGARIASRILWGPEGLAVEHVGGASARRTARDPGASPDVRRAPARRPQTPAASRQTRDAWVHSSGVAAKLRGVREKFLRGPVRRVGAAGSSDPTVTSRAAIVEHCASMALVAARTVHETLTGIAQHRQEKLIRPSNQAGAGVAAI